MPYTSLYIQGKLHKHKVSRRRSSPSQRGDYLPPLWKEDLQLRQLIWTHISNTCKFAANGLTYNNIPQSEFPEFLHGMMEEEDRFQKDWEVIMRGWGSQHQNVAKLWIDSGKGVLVGRFAYKPSVIDEIRQRIPTGKKSWDAERKVWEFSAETVDTILDILNHHYDKVIDLTQESIQVPSQNMGGDSLLKLLDKEDIHRIRVLLSKKYHSDAGGDGERMSKINAALDQYKMKGDQS